MQPGALRIGVDTGGTFTDVVLQAPAGGQRLTHKLLSTPDDPARAVLAGVAHVLGQWADDGGQRGQPGSAARIVHGSTVATNALLEGKVARCAYVTTAGFEDVPWIGRQNRRELYALEPARDEPPLSRDDALGISERLGADGGVISALDGDEVERLIARLRELDVQAVVVNLLHSYVNPAHEQLIASALRQALPELHLTVSCELLPEFREYERAATCIANAAVAPLMVEYLGRLERELPAGSLRIMASAGGSLPPDVVAREPVHTILSGPAGGVVGAFQAARASGIERVISFDMGGTSTDVSLCDGGLTYTTQSEIAGLPVRLPLIDIHTVGAGGGSIAWLDSGGALRVGPRSMGADPGPACYGKQRAPYTATVTDAHLVLGHLSADEPLGDGLRLDAAAAREAVEWLARDAGLEAMQAAAGILRVAEATMARAIKRISLERGHDPRDFALLPFGGAGGLHAAALAGQLGIARILVPRDPGLLSALGMLSAAPLYTYSQAVMQEATPQQAAAGLEQLLAVGAALAMLRDQAERALDAEGLPAERRVYEPALDLRYRGQSYELTVPLGPDCAARFAAMHERLYGYRADERTLVVVAARLRAGGIEEALEYAGAPARTTPLGELPRIMLHDGAGEYEAGRIRREQLCAGDELSGPLIVAEYSATTFVPRGWRLAVDGVGQLLLDSDRAREAGND